MLNEVHQQINYRREAVLGFAYFVIFLGYLFFYQENEFMHWLTLVIIPFLLFYIYQKRYIPELKIKDTLASFGLRRGNLKNGLFWAVLLGLALSVLQLFISERSEAMWELVRSGKVIWMFPLAFVLLLLTAGFTEEWFFRGILQTRFSGALGSKFGAIILTSIVFSLYHVPYLYFKQNRPFTGDLGASISAAFVDGMLGGLILGVVYEKFEHNLVATIIVHAMIDILPAMTMIKFGGG